MKKLLLVLAVAGVFAACNNEKKPAEGETKIDSPKTETPAPAPVTGDTATTPAPATKDTAGAAK